MLNSGRPQAAASARDQESRAEGVRAQDDAGISEALGRGSEAGAKYGGTS